MKFQRNQCLSMMSQRDTTPYTKKVPDSEREWPHRTGKYQVIIQTAGVSSKKVNTTQKRKISKNKNSLRLNFI